MKKNSLWGNILSGATKKASKFGSSSELKGNRNVELQMKNVANVILARGDTKNEREVFYIQANGFDSHFQASANAAAFHATVTNSAGSPIFSSIAHDPSPSLFGSFALTFIANVTGNVHVALRYDGVDAATKGDNSAKPYNNPPMTNVEIKVPTTAYRHMVVKLEKKPFLFNL